MPQNCLIYLVIITVICGLFGTCDCVRNRVKNKFKRKVDSLGDITHNNLENSGLITNSTSQGQGRGFFPGLFSLGKVLNFFPVGGERECQPSGFTVARAGICLNQYDCRQRDGRSAGDCAHGLGVCCVFEVTCGGTVQNNLTYFMSPGFPEIWTGDQDCNITVEKTHAGVTQLRIDFVHFTIGQPNRTTGECDEDAMTLGGDDNKFKVCGQNHGQHIYYTLPSDSEVREVGDLPSTKSTRLSIQFGNTEMPRLWLLRLAQMPLANSAPHDCLQYFTGNNGTIKTFNFAINGRHLAGQEYRACVRRNVGNCAVRYTPCDSRSFRIGPGRDAPQVIDPSGVQQMMPADEQVQDEEEGSGADPQIAPVIEQPVPPPSIASRIWSFIWPSWLWGQRAAARGYAAARGPAAARGRDQGHERGRFWGRWSPYAQHYPSEEDDSLALRYYGYGNFGQGFGRRRCTDRLTVPCENEYFVSSSTYMSGVCDPHHCGDSFCPGVRYEDCRVETSVSPFAVSIHFGPPTPKRSPEENIGACLRYTQLPCEG